MTESFHVPILFDHTVIKRLSRKVHGQTLKTVKLCDRIMVENHGKVRAGDGGRAFRPPEKE